MKKKPVQRVRIRWKFDDGTEGLMPLVDHEAQLQAQYHAMATSDDPSLRKAGREHLQAVAEAVAAQRWADMQRAENSKLPRRKSTIRQRVQEAMRPFKANGTEFKLFMAAWEREAIDGLRLTLVGDAYLIDDENAEAVTGENAALPKYKWAALQKLYYTC